MEKPFFERQWMHLLGAAALVVAAAWITQQPDLTGGETVWGLSSTGWIWFSVACAILHQAWVMLFWRAELHYGWVSRQLGSPRGFNIYGRGFGFWALLRFGSLVTLGLTDPGSLALGAGWRYGLSLAIIILAGWLMYSVLKFFSIERALGADHFDPRFRELGLEQRGIFRYVRNGMYTAGLLALYLPGLLLASRLALILGLLQHLYVWVHYFATEKPDMARIYS